MWLDEIEGNLFMVRDVGTRQKMERMARVLRELAGHIKDVKAWATHAGIHLVEFENDVVMERLCTTAGDSWENLSDDAKELLIP